jgi:hypothetical protein
MNPNEMPDASLEIPEIMDLEEAQKLDEEENKEWDKLLGMPQGRGLNTKEDEEVFKHDPTGKQA